jgi:hypothetical protein
MDEQEKPIEFDKVVDALVDIHDSEFLASLTDEQWKSLQEEYKGVEGVLDRERRRRYKNPEWDALVAPGGEVETVMRSLDAARKAFADYLTETNASWPQRIFSVRIARRPDNEEFVHLLNLARRATGGYNRVRDMRKDLLKWLLPVDTEVHSIDGHGAELADFMEAFKERLDRELNDRMQCHEAGHKFCASLLGDEFDGRMEALEAALEKLYSLIYFFNGEDGYRDEDVDAIALLVAVESGT